MNKVGLKGWNDTQDLYFSDSTLKDFVKIGYNVVTSDDYDHHWMIYYFKSLVKMDENFYEDFEFNLEIWL